MSYIDKLRAAFRARGKYRSRGGRLARRCRPLGAGDFNEVLTLPARRLMYAGLDGLALAQVEANRRVAIPIHFALNVWDTADVRRRLEQLAGEGGDGSS